MRESRTVAAQSQTPQTRRRRDSGKTRTTLALRRRADAANSRTGGLQGAWESASGRRAAARRWGVAGEPRRRLPGAAVAAVCCQLLGRRQRGLLRLLLLPLAMARPRLPPRTAWPGLALPVLLQQPRMRQRQQQSLCLPRPHLPVSPRTFSAPQAWGVRTRRRYQQLQQAEASSISSSSGISCGRGASTALEEMLLQLDELSPPPSLPL